MTRLKDPWYILTPLGDCTQVLSLYRKRWGIEMMFRDCKSGGYNLESTRTNEIRLLALILIVAIAYTLATSRGLTLDEKPLNDYIARRDKTSNGEHLIKVMSKNAQAVLRRPLR
jgi:hypothetical protein